MDMIISAKVKNIIINNDFFDDFFENILIPPYIIITLYNKPLI